MGENELCVRVCVRACGVTKGSKGERYALKVEGMIREASNVYLYDRTRSDDHGILSRLKIAWFAGARENLEQSGELGRLVRDVVDGEGQALGAIGIDRDVEVEVEHLVCWP